MPEHAAYAVEPTRDAEKNLKRLRPWTDQATRAILKLEEQPYLGHSLTGSLKGARSLEFSQKGGGEYRAIHVVLEDAHTCLVFVVGPP